MSLSSIDCIHLDRRRWNDIAKMMTLERDDVGVPVAIEDVNSVCAEDFVEVRIEVGGREENGD